MKTFIMVSLIFFSQDFIYLIFGIFISFIPLTSGNWSVKTEGVFISKPHLDYAPDDFEEHFKH